MVLKFTNANDEVLDFRGSDVVVNAIEGTGAAPVETFLAERAFREGASYVRRRSRPRIITISFSFLGRSQTLWEAKREIDAKLSPALSLGTLEYRPAGADRSYEIDGSVIRLDTRQLPGYGVGAVQIECPFPFWRDAAQKSQTINVSSTTTTNTISVGGELPVYPVVTIGEAHSGTFNNPTWRNTTHGGIMATSGLAEAVGVVADHEHSTLVRLSTAINYMHYVTETSEFWALRPGNNSVQCLATGSGTKDFVFRWYELYSGV